MKLEIEVADNDVIRIIPKTFSACDVTCLVDGCVRQVAYYEFQSRMGLCPLHKAALRPGAGKWEDVED